MGRPANRSMPGKQKDATLFWKIEVQGGAQIKTKRPDCVSIFILPPSLEVLEKRLRRRGTDAEEAIQKRLAAAKSEIAQAIALRLCSCQ